VGPLRPCALAFAWVLACLSLQARAEATGWQFGSDLRSGVFASERDQRDLGSSSEVSARARLRVSVEREVTPQWRSRARLAGSFDTAGNDLAFRIDPYRATGTGTRSGEVHVDEFFAGWQAADTRHRLRVGRFQTAFNLPVVPGKSLDRNDSSNVGIGWTDGLHWQSRLGNSWEGHAIAQFNHRRGTGNTARAPLSFRDNSSRVGTYLGLRSTDHFGPLTLRMLSLNWIPNALATDGPDNPQRDDYLTVAAKAAATWPMNERGMRVVLAGEFGRALNRPRRDTVRIPGEGRAGGNAWQLSANLFDIAPGHHLGAVYGRAEAGWLTSNDFRNNDALLEVRYQRRFTPALSMELRFRQRDELERRIDAARPQRDRDVYARFTWRML